MIQRQVAAAAVQAYYQRLLGFLGGYFKQKAAVHSAMAIMTPAGLTVLVFGDPVEAAAEDLQGAMAAARLMDALTDDGPPVNVLLQQGAAPAWIKTPAAEGERRCRVCGCTDDHTCAGCHSWVEADLCSGCADTLSVKPNGTAGQ